MDIFVSPARVAAAGGQLVSVEFRAPGGRRGTVLFGYSLSGPVSPIRPKNAIDPAGCLDLEQPAGSGRQFVFQPATGRRGTGFADRCASFNTTMTET
jgi:hypothetical protein